MNGIILNQSPPSLEAQDIFNIIGYTPVKKEEVVSSITLVNGKTENTKIGDVKISKADIGLGNVENYNKQSLWTNVNLQGNAFAPTPNINSDSAQIATTHFINDIINNKKRIFSLPSGESQKVVNVDVEGNYFASTDYYSSKELLISNFAISNYGFQLIFEDGSKKVYDAAGYISFDDLSSFLSDMDVDTNGMKEVNGYVIDDGTTYDNHIYLNFNSIPSNALGTFSMSVFLSEEDNDTGNIRLIFEAPTDWVPINDYYSSSTSVEKTIPEMIQYIINQIS